MEKNREQDMEIWNSFQNKLTTQQVHKIKTIVLDGLRDVLLSWGSTDTISLYTSIYPFDTSIYPVSERQRYWSDKQKHNPIKKKMLIN